MEIVRHAKRTIIRELIAHQFMRHEPTDEYTCQETRNGQEHLTRHEVEDLEQ